MLFQATNAMIVGMRTFRIRPLILNLIFLIFNCDVVSLYSDVTISIFLSVVRILCFKQSCFSEGPLALERGELL